MASRIPDRTEDGQVGDEPAAGGRSIPPGRRPKSETPSESENTSESEKSEAEKAETDIAAGDVADDLADFA